MPKANKHAEVKPSKYKTSLCQFFLRKECCPFAERCAFAHGEEELQTESKNLELLKAAGLQRLDRQVAEGAAAAAAAAANTSVKDLSGKATNGTPTSVCEEGNANSVTPPHSPTTLSEEQSSYSSSCADCFAAGTAWRPPQPEGRPYSPTVPTARQRRPVMVSLPKYGTANDRYTSPYTGQRETYGYAQFSLNGPQYQQATPLVVSHYPQEPQQPEGRPQCACGFGATCRQDQPATYRHNPYRSLTSNAEYY